MKTLTIDRSRWLRGEKDQGTLYRKTDGKMCCLGFFARQCGLPQTEIEGHREPHDPLCNRFIGPVRDDFNLVVEAEEEVEDDYDGPLTVVRWSSSPLACELMRVNDDHTIDDARREEELRSLLKAAEIEVVFVDGSTPTSGTEGDTK